MGLGVSAFMVRMGCFESSWVLPCRPVSRGSVKFNFLAIPPIKQLHPI